MSHPLLEILSLSVEIERVPILSDISLEVKTGEVLALVGPNGSGKTTLLKAISGELALKAGSVQLDDKPFNQWNPRELAQRVAILPQKSVLNFPFTGREVVALGRTPHETGQEIDKYIIDEVLDYLDAGYLADRLYPNLSGGEQQRIQLARVLVQIWTSDEGASGATNSPKLLLLDEPSSYFDLAHQQMLVELVQELAQRNIAVLIVVHDLNLALACADRIAVMSCGRLIKCGAAADVITPALIRDVFSVNSTIIEDPETGRSMLSLGGLS